MTARRRPTPTPASRGEETFALQVRAAGLPEPVREFRFAPPRRWRFDFSWPERWVAVEIEGGLWGYGRHNRPKGYLADMEKYREAAVLGWRVLRYSTAEVECGRAIAQVTAVLTGGAE